MQVIFIPEGTRPSHNLKLRIRYIVSAVALVLLLVGVAGSITGYRVGSKDRIPAELIQQFTQFSADELLDLKIALDQQRQRLHDAQGRLVDHFDTLGRQLGRVQAHVSRLNALGKRLIDMADMDQGEFSFDNDPALGGIERPGASSWGYVKEAEFTKLMQQIEVSLKDKEHELKILEALLNDRSLHANQYPTGWPVASGGWISSPYGHRTDPFTGRKAFHDGVDIATKPGSELSAMAAGVVVFSGEKVGYGKLVEINHGNGYHTRYAHADKLIAKVGDRVEKGDVIAIVGSTGRSTGTHVHFEVLKNGKVVNPSEYLKSSG